MIYEQIDINYLRFIKKFRVEPSCLLLTKNTYDCLIDELKKMPTTLISFEYYNGANVLIIEKEEHNIKFCLVQL